MLIAHRAVEAPLRHVIARRRKMDAAELLFDSILRERWLGRYRSRQRSERGDEDLPDKNERAHRPLPRVACPIRDIFSSKWAAYKDGTPKGDSVTGWPLANSVRSVRSFAIEVK